MLFEGTSQRLQLRHSLYQSLFLAILLSPPGGCLFYVPNFEIDLLSLADDISLLLQYICYTLLQRSHFITNLAIQDHQQFTCGCPPYLLYAVLYVFLRDVCLDFPEYVRIGLILLCTKFLANSLPVFILVSRLAVYHLRHLSH